jgi:hypothetical protein
MSTTVDWSSIGFAIWGCACLVALMLLACFWKTAANAHFVRRSYMVYLAAQSIGSVLQLISNQRFESTWINWAFWQVLLLAGGAYMAIGVAISAAVFVKEKQQQENGNNEPQPEECIIIQNDDSGMCRSIPRRTTFVQWGLGIGILVLIAVSIVLLVVQLVASNSNDWLAIIVFVYYFPAALLAWVCVIKVWWSMWPTGAMTVSAPAVAVESTTEEASSSTTSSRQCDAATWIRRISVVAASMGMVNYLLPALEYVATLSIWESTFLTRLLDSIIYLPGILPWIIWIDRQEPFLASLSIKSILKPE